MPPLPVIPEFPSPEKIKTLDNQQLEQLAADLRAFIIDAILVQGGHFAANLGVIELTIALLNQFDTLQQPLVWDVGHQCYPYKILTDRKYQFESIRTFQGISGFPKISESPFDHFGTGHSSTSISAIMGMATASQLHGINQPHIAVIGDGALTGGMALEALNNLWQSNLNVIIILNDNNIGIDPNTGAISQNLKNNYQIKEFFEWYGLEYTGPIDGHNIPLLIESFEKLKLQSQPRLLHIKTTKGKGYEPAEKEQTRWHSAPKYDKFQPEKPSPEKPKKWSDAFGETLLKRMKTHENIIGISPAMTSSCGMSSCMEAFPKRIFDVGISEQHALTFAAGAAKQGLLPVVNIYSTFLQRAYDQFIHDIALQNLPVLLCIDRAGLVGEDGPTHHGVFDVSFLLPIPNIRVFCPNTIEELESAFEWYLQNQVPCAIRYPRGNVPQNNHLKNLILHSNRNNHDDNTTGSTGSIAVVSCGNATNWAINAFLDHNRVDLIHFNQIKPLEKLDFLKRYTTVITLEDGSVVGGFGHYLKSQFDVQHPDFMGKQRWFHKGIPDQFVTHGSPSELQQMLELDNVNLSNFVDNLLE